MDRVTFTFALLLYRGISIGSAISYPLIAMPFSGGPSKFPTFGSLELLPMGNVCSITGGYTSGPTPRRDTDVDSVAESLAIKIVGWQDMTTN